MSCVKCDSKFDLKLKKYTLIAMVQLYVRMHIGITSKNND